MYLAGYAICITSSGFSERHCRWRKTRNTFLFLLFVYPDKQKLRKLVTTVLQERLRESDRLKGKDAGQFSNPPKHVSVTGFFSYLCEYMCLCTCMHMCVGPGGGQMGMSQYSGAGFTGGCELPDASAGNKTGVLERAGVANH